MVEGSLAGLESAQSEGLMRLSSTLSSSLTDAEAMLQVMDTTVSRYIYTRLQLERGYSEYLTFYGGFCHT